jgi:hypothetical protein
MTSCFAATPSRMMRSANLHVNKSPAPPQISRPAVPSPSVNRKPISKPKWNPQKGKH